MNTGLQKPEYKAYISGAGVWRVRTLELSRFNIIFYFNGYPFYFRDACMRMLNICDKDFRIYYMDKNLNVIIYTMLLTSNAKKA